MKKILLTGSRGFVGQALESRLSSDYEIYGLDVQREDDPSTQYISCDIRNYGQIEAKLAPFEFDGVIHCAALAHITRKTSPEEVLSVNAGGTKNLVQFFSQRGQLKFFVLFSSVAVYGEKDYAGLVTEGDTIRPVSVYGQSKVLAENELMASPLPWIVFRFAPIYGIGQMKDVFKRISPMGGRMRFRIGDGDQRGSYCSIRTVADVVEFAVRETSRMQNQVFNVADIGSDYSLEYLLNLVRAEKGQAPELYVPKWLLKVLTSVASWVLPGSREAMSTVYWKLAENNLYSTDKLRNWGFDSLHNLGEMMSSQLREANQG